MLYLLTYLLTYSVIARNLRTQSAHPRTNFSEIEQFLGELLVTVHIFYSAFLPLLLTQETFQRL